jgi:hypothetical protein
VANVSLITRGLKRMCGSGWDNSQKTSMLPVSTHWQSDVASLSVLVEDMWRNKCFFQVRISHVSRFISICDLFTDSRNLYSFRSILMQLYQERWI